MALAVAAVLLAIAPVAAGRPGTLDPTYGKGGFLETELPYGLSDLVRQPDGLFVGEIADRYGTSLARLGLDGRLDRSFGSGGVVSTGLGYNSENKTGPLVDRGGRIVVAGPGRSRLQVERYLSNGTPDRTFGTNGVVALDTAGASFAYLRASAIDWRGRVLVAALHVYTRGRFADWTYKLSLTRLMRSGDLDATFSGDGRLFVQETSRRYETSFQPAHLAILRGGDIAPVSDNGRVWRFKSNGARDRRYGQNGEGLIPSSGWIEDLVLDTENRLVAIHRDTPSMGFDEFGTAAVTRTRRGGLPDTRFRAIFESSDFFARDLLGQPDGKYLATGTVTDTCGYGRGEDECREGDVWVARVPERGGRDRAFGTRGVARFSAAEADAYLTANGALLLPDERPLVSATLNRRGSTVGVLIRLVDSVAPAPGRLPARLVMRHGRVRVPITCRGRETKCRATLVAHWRKAASAPERRLVRVRTRPRWIAAGRRHIAILRLPKGLRRAVARRSRPVGLRLTVSDATGNADTRIRRSHLLSG